MSERPTPTPTQQRYKDVMALSEATGVPMTPEDLAAATGGRKEDFAGVLLVEPAEDVKGMPAKREERLLGMAGMGPQEGQKEGHKEDPIGFAQIVRDLEELVRKVRSR